MIRDETTDENRAMRKAAWTPKLVRRATTTFEFKSGYLAGEGC
jgi:hypothetical protein